MSVYVPAGDGPRRVQPVDLTARDVARMRRIGARSARQLVAVRQIMAEAARAERDDTDGAAR